eukprot:5971541-Pyramimonas_sp.AAC.2
MLLVSRPPIPLVSCGIRTLPKEARWRTRGRGPRAVLGSTSPALWFTSGRGWARREQGWAQLRRVVRGQRGVGGEGNADDEWDEGE